MKSFDLKNIQPPTFEEEVERFREALEGVPDIAERHAAGQKFNAYDVAGDDEDDEGDYGKFVCIGPITSRPVSLVQVPSDVGLLLEAALRVASSALSRQDSSQ